MTPPYRPVLRAQPRLSHFDGLFRNRLRRSIREPNRPFASSGDHSPNSRLESPEYRASTIVYMGIVALVRQGYVRRLVEQTTT